ncbi:porin [Rhodobacter sp. HX-7-19]|uniref:Porin n=1 Tax=Paragemmobacter kunshanensis TaxID=2583234 RepID=A0A6M1TNC1_9RHOB|nr:porin [Rhodobacter kunshanensis]NGQ89547.1 porin [Rhodobacter kunshanensis]
MKKILLATTMLAGTAGIAAAEVAVTGYAEIGIIRSEAGFAGSTNAQFHQDVEVTFTMSGETDGGLSFGAAIDLDETNVAAGDDSGTTVFVSGAFGKLTMGDTDGALDWAVADAGALTSMGDDHTTHLFYFAGNGLDGSHDNQVVRYEYSFGDFGVALSYEQAGNNATGTLADDNVAIGATYSMDMGGTALKFGLGYQAGSDAPTAAAVYTNGDAIGASVSAELAGGFAVSLGYIKYDFDATNVAGGAATMADFAHTGLGVTYTTGALSLHANVGHFNPDVGASDSTYGLAVNYDLGGGAVVMAGYGSDVGAAAGDQSQYSIGLGLSF